MGSVDGLWFRQFEVCGFGCLRFEVSAVYGFSRRFEVSAVYGFSRRFEVSAVYGFSRQFVVYGFS